MITIDMLDDKEPVLITGELAKKLHAALEAAGGLLVLNHELEMAVVYNKTNLTKLYRSMMLGTLKQALGLDGKEEMEAKTSDEPKPVSV